MAALLPRGWETSESVRNAEPKVGKAVEKCTGPT